VTFAAARAAAAPPPSAWTAALAGAASLAVAMGIGRFAFTPILPMMLAEGALDLHAASWLATANYLGYLLGALLCAVQPWIAARVPAIAGLEGPRTVRAGLAATVVLTLAMAVPWPAAWPTWRFLAGVASAYVLVHTSGWCLAVLARRQATRLGGVMFTGPGAGIVLSGLVAGALVLAHHRAVAGWLVFGALAAALSAFVWGVVGRPAGPPLAAAAAARRADELAGEAHGSLEIATLGLAYGLAGFGYIITATFLPVIARTALPGSPWIDLFWPVLGAGVVAGALLATRLELGGDLRALLAIAYLMQAAGIAVGAVWPSEAGFVIGSLLIGLPFTAITFFAMQEARLVRPQRVASTMGLLTALYGIGQIVGPPLVALVLRHSASTAAGFDLALGIAAGALVVGALLYGVLVRTTPKPRA
jgi:MFS family permease